MTSIRRLLHPVSFSGYGLHTGEPSEVLVAPLPSESGPALEIGGESAPLDLCPVSGAGRGTTVSLPHCGLRARTTEHLFAALAALGLWSVRISLKGPEVPAADGCSALFAGALFEASTPETDLSVRTRAFSPAFPVTIVDGEKESLLSLFPGRALRLSYVIEYAERPIGTRMATFDAEKDDFRTCIAEARTFALDSEIERLRAAGLARGGSLDNAVVVGDETVQASGGLRFPDEFVRHKILDLLGDLYLLGCPLNARITAIRAGHAMHCVLVDRLRRLRGVGRRKKTNDLSIKETNYA